MNSSTPIKRLRQFVGWARMQGLCKSEYDFERRCGLSVRYIANNVRSSKGNLGTESLGRITGAYPQLNLVWICTGKGNMLNEDSSVTLNFKDAYEAAMMQVEALNRIVKQLQDRIAKLKEQ